VEICELKGILKEAVVTESRQSCCVCFERLKKITASVRVPAVLAEVKPRTYGIKI
jgi:hypothetical protein